MSGFEDEELPGFIFMCNSNTKPQCFQYRVFGLPSVRLETVKKIKCGAKLFLYDFQEKRVYGIYEATSSGNLNIQPDAFNGRFPSQVSFKIYKDCLSLPEDIFKRAIPECYNGPRFNQELTSVQVKDLMELFKPIHVETTYSRELHQQSTSYQRRLSPPQSWYYTPTQQTGHRQDSAYFYNQYDQQIPRYYGTQVAAPHLETRNINVYPRHFPVNDPNKWDVSAYFHGNQPSHHAIAAQPHHDFDGSRMFDPNGSVVNAYFHGNQSPHHAIAAAQTHQGYANPPMQHTFYQPSHHAIAAQPHHDFDGSSMFDPNERVVSACIHGNQSPHHSIAVALPHQGYANPNPMQYTFYQPSPYYHYNPVAAQRPVQSQTYVVPHQGDGAGPSYGHVGTSYYHPQYSGRRVVVTYQPYNDNIMYQQLQPPYNHQQYHGSAAAVGAVGGQLQVYESGNNVLPPTQAEPNLPASLNETSCSDSN